MKLIKQGAEAKVYASEYLGQRAVVKMRERKSYREQILDEKILRERMRTECSLLARAKRAGVRTPIIWKIDFSQMAITTEHISGKTLKQELSGKSAGAGKLCTQMGKEIAKLHSADLVHGDLTTSNIILHNGKLVFLDFGLGEVSSKIESKAVDLLVLKKTFAATHFRIIGKWKEVEKAYSKTFSGAEAVLAQMKEVEGRARYY